MTRSPTSIRMASRGWRETLFSLRALARSLRARSSQLPALNSARFSDDVEVGELWAALPDLADTPLPDGEWPQALSLWPQQVEEGVTAIKGAVGFGFEAANGGGISGAPEALSQRGGRDARRPAGPACDCAYPSRLRPGPVVVRPR